MDQERDEHLSDIATTWTLFYQAHEGASEAAQAARRETLERYGPAVHRYLQASVRNADVADDLYQEFALRFVRGDFKRAHPDQGRLRDFLKTTLVNLVTDYRRNQSKQMVSLEEQGPEPADDQSLTFELDREFLSIWRTQLLACAWKALKAFEDESGQPLHTVLRFRAQNTELHSAEMAAQLSAQLGHGITPEWVRKRLHYARQKFRELLVTEVAGSLEKPNVEKVEQELLELGLLEHCRSALESRRQDD